MIGRAFPRSFIHDYDAGDNGTVTVDGFNLFVGENCGNRTNGATATATYQGSRNLGVGANNLELITTGYINTALGSECLKNLTTGNYNTAIGAYALRGVTTGVQNVGIGPNALIAVVNGNNNTGIGINSLRLVGNGVNNLAIGHKAGYSAPYSASRNVFLGYEAGYSETGNDKLYISNSNTTTPLIKGDFSASNITINGSHEITKSVRTSATETITTSTDNLDDSNYFVRGDCSSNAITLTLPAVSGNVGLTYIIKKVDSTGNSLTIDGNASETIDGSATVTISSQYDSITIICNGTTWDIV